MRTRETSLRQYVLRVQVNSVAARCPAYYINPAGYPVQRSHSLHAARTPHAVRLTHAACSDRAVPAIERDDSSSSACAAAPPEPPSDGPQHHECPPCLPKQRPNRSRTFKTGGARIVMRRRTSGTFGATRCRLRRRSCWRPTAMAAAQAGWQRRGGGGRASGRRRVGGRRLATAVLQLLVAVLAAAQAG